MTKLYREGGRTFRRIEKGLLIVEGLYGGIGERVSIETPLGEQLGEIVSIEDGCCVVRVSRGTAGLDPSETTVWLEGDVPSVVVGDESHVKVLNGWGEPFGETVGDAERRVPLENPSPNHLSRLFPPFLIETGIGAVDMTCPIFSGQTVGWVLPHGMPAWESAMRLARSVKVGATSVPRPVSVIFAVIGSRSAEVRELTAQLREDVRFPDSAIVAADTTAPVAERFSVPRAALALGEYLAFEKDRDVLVFLSDMCAWHRAWTEIDGMENRGGDSRKELQAILGRLYGRAGCSEKGSLTVFPVFRVPEGLSHPVLEVSETLVEGRIVWSRKLYEEGKRVPLDVLASTSFSLGRRKIRGGSLAELRYLVSQLVESYGTSLKIGDIRLGLRDAFESFGRSFEECFFDQTGRATLAQSEAAGWEILSSLPASELYLLPESIRQEILESGKRMRDPAK